MSDVSVAPLERLKEIFNAARESEPEARSASRFREFRSSSSGRKRQRLCRDVNEQLRNYNVYRALS